MRLKVETDLGETAPDWIMDVVEQFENCLNLVVEKTGGYGKAWQAQGWMGNLARIMSKTSRLKNLLWNQEAQQNVHLAATKESVDDTLQDLVNLSVFMLLNREAGNKWGAAEGDSETVGVRPAENIRFAPARQRTEIVEVPSEEMVRITTWDYKGEGAPNRPAPQRSF